jgi:uncharacterized membrane protein YcaP (DUF421 family)
MESLLAIVLRVSIIYLYILTVLRISGKRSFDTLSPLDLIMSVIVGDMFDDIFWAEIPIAKGIVGITTILLLQVTLSFAEYRSRKLSGIIAGTKTALVKEGKIVERSLEKQRLRKETLDSQLRLNEVDNFDELKDAYLETSGHVSVSLKPEAKRAQKQDLKLLEEVLQ